MFLSIVQTEAVTPRHQLLTCAGRTTGPRPLWQDLVHSLLIFMTDRSSNLVSALAALLTLISELTASKLNPSHRAMANIPEGTILAIENAPGTYTHTTSSQANAAQALAKATAPPPTQPSCGAGCDQCHSAPCIRHKPGHLWHCCFACRDSWAVQQARSRYW